MYFVKEHLFTAVLVAGIVLGTVVAPVLVGAPVQSAAAASADSTIVVDADGDAEYQSVQTAVEDATDGDTVEVRPGTYTDPVFVEDNVTLVAPDGATLDGSEYDEELGGVRIVPGSNAEPVIDGFTITGFEKGIFAEDTTGDWTARNVTLRELGDEGVEVENTSGDWTVRNATIIGNVDGFDIDRSGGDWRVIDTVVRDNEEQAIDGEYMTGDWTIRRSEFSTSRQGILALHATGTWLIANSTFRNNDRTGIRLFNSSGTGVIRDSDFYGNRLVGISAIDTTGDWRMQNVRIWNNSVGIHAELSSGDWTVENASIWNIETPGFFFDAGGTGVFAANTSGAWEVHNSSIVRTERYKINATDAAQQGDATNNWWGRASGATDEECLGNVDCGEPRSQQPSGNEPLTETTASDTDADEPTTSASRDSSGSDPMAMTEADDSGPRVPGFGPVVAVLAVLAGVFLLARRR